MKCQIAAQTLRLRMDEAELERLLREGDVEDTTRFAPLLGHTRRLCLTDTGEPELRLEGATLTVALPRPWFEAFAAERPRRDGLAFEWPVSDAQLLRIVVEIDVRDSHRRSRTGRDERGFG